MYTGENEVENQTQALPILRCELCNKPFDKQSTLKRHGYYCRSRRTGHANRNRSCIPCAKAKARCDGRRPVCSRCAGRAADCCYPAGTGVSASVTARSDRNQQAKTPTSTDSGSSESQDATPDHLVVMDSEIEAETANLNSNANLGLGFEIGGEYLPWDDIDIDFTDFLNLPGHTMSLNSNGVMAAKDIQYPSPSSSSSIPVQISPETVQRPPEMQQTTPLPPAITSLPRLLVPRPTPKRGAQRATALIQHTLKSYLGHLRHDTLPPFIHPLSVPADLNKSDSPNNRTSPLTRCIDWIRKPSSKSTTGQALFWGNVRGECEWLCAEYSKLDRSQLLSAMQAVAFYILLRIDEGETEYNNLDFLLLATVTVLAKQITWDSLDSLHPQPQPYTESQSPAEVDTAWKEWVFEESRRRLAVIYRIINILVYFEPAARCDLPKDLVFAPLPAKKQLWEALDAAAWKREVDRDPKGQTAFGLVDSGELIKFEVHRDQNQDQEDAEGVDDRNGDKDSSQDTASRRKGRGKARGKVLTRHEDLLLQVSTSENGKSLVRTEVGWEEWCEGMDGFGSIVLLVASMVA
ncbi:hypothetical protein BJX68DRAFT_235154 [Aspergillus pseudodeflectus]|uniref:Zn(2)-C6 fungal-type domain-containing protein n=1 Tax=Aspergillus pseudodeflectus TaxID=176178 RepID=A0ABR4KJ04_9EURO